MSLFKTDENTAIEWAKIFTKPIFNKGLVSKVYKEFSKLIIKKKKQRIPQKMSKRHECTFHIKENTDNKHMKLCSTS